jgi:hypothetical protein
MFIHKNIYSDGVYNVCHRSLSDFEFVLENLLRHPDLFFYIPQVYVNYRLDGISSHTSFFRGTKDNYVARKNAGLGLFHRLLAIAVATAVFVVYSIKSFMHRW